MILVLREVYRHSQLGLTIRSKNNNNNNNNNNNKIRKIEVRTKGFPKVEIG